VQLVERRCEACEAPLPTVGRRDRRYCDARCRAAASARRRRKAADAAPGATSAIPPELQEALDRALAEPLLVGYIARAARSNWRASAWLLERRYPGRWGPGRTGNAEPDDLTDDFAEVDQLAARRREQMRRPE